MERFYCCYLLESEKLRYRTYIGFTMEPRRRLRQHNGEISAGAWKTRKWRPWRMVLCVWGFPTRIAALQFEYAWQHPAICRHARVAASRFSFCKLTALGRQRLICGVAKNVQVLQEMLQVSPYCRMPLRVHQFDEGAAASSRASPGLLQEEKLPAHVVVTRGSFEDLEEICAEEFLASQRPVASESCTICAAAFKEMDRVVACGGCDTPFHVRCAARALTQEHATMLIPADSMACPNCGRGVEWPMLVRSARRFTPGRQASLGARKASPPPSQQASVEIALTDDEADICSDAAQEEAERPAPMPQRRRRSNKRLRSAASLGAAPARPRRRTKRRTAAGSVDAGEAAAGESCEVQSEEEAAAEEEASDSLRQRLLRRRQGDASVLCI
eukprot:TRINITY_DN100917_c0_g1_i1.p1 TRINITY_DN100917_c0_g1~~TRINITY_DN100917_c0_g1_i1.p1  ORF type:complete len:386 (+),score=101.05 TRINITY_DN100917_c0_g1_i1:55-1212(+)